MPQREVRHLQIRVVPVTDGPQQDGLPRRFTARVVNYLRLDDYGTVFAPGCFTESLAQRLPRLLYGHAGWVDPGSVLGRGVAYVDHPEGLDVTFEFDDFTFVPAARQIAAQLVSGTLDQFSIGFVRTAPSQQIDLNGQQVEAIMKARLPESSVVLEGSVPDTGVLAFRARRPNERVALIDANEAVAIMSRLALGEVDLHDALGQVKAATVVDDGAKPDEATAPPAAEPETPPTPDDEPDLPDAAAAEPEPGEEPLSDEDAAALLAELDETLGEVGDRHDLKGKGEAA